MVKRAAHSQSESTCKLGSVADIPINCTAGAELLRTEREVVTAVAESVTAGAESVTTGADSVTTGAELGMAVADSNTAEAGQLTAEEESFADPKTPPVELNTRNTSSYFTKKQF